MLNLDEMKVIESNARAFSAIHKAAHHMVDLLEQSFEVRIKSSDAAYNVLKLLVKNPASYLGKTVTASVRWDAMGGVEHQDYMFLRLGDDYNSDVLLNEQDMKALCTQKGKIAQMYAVWHYARYGE